MKEFIEKLIGRLEELKDQYTDDCFVQKMMATEDVIKIVNELAEEYKGGWIPVSERLPDVGVTVLCYWKKYDRYDNTTSYYYSLMHRNEDCHWIDAFGLCYGNVLAWQYLEPYKEGNNDEN